MKSELKLSATHTVTAIYCHKAGEILPVLNGTKCSRDNGGFAGQGIQIRSAGAIEKVNTFLASAEVKAEVKAALLADAASYNDDSTYYICAEDVGSKRAKDALTAASACLAAAAKI